MAKLERRLRMYHRVTPTTVSDIGMIDVGMGKYDQALLGVTEVYNSANDGGETFLDSAIPNKFSCSQPRS